MQKPLSLVLNISKDILKVYSQKITANKIIVRGGGEYLC